MRQVLLFAAWAWANAEACASCQGKAWTRRSGNDDNNNINAISPNSGGEFAQFACRTVPASGADMGKRASLKGDCDQNKDAIETALKTCVQYAQAAATEAKKTDSQLFEFFFKKENDGQRDKIAEQYQQIAAECGATQGGNISVTCQDNTLGSCGTSTAMAEMKMDNRLGTRVQLCRPFFDLRAGSCGQSDRPSTIVHELSHALVGTKDFDGSYGLRAIRGLKAAQNFEHADTFGFFSQAASLGCTTDELERVSQATVLPPGQGTQPSTGQLEGTQPSTGQLEGTWTQPSTDQGAGSPISQWSHSKWPASTPEQGDRIVYGA
ncbi:metallo-endopeptidase [Metarhizium brunneum]